MKALSLRQKGRAIKLFLEGYPYDEIGRREGIAKGSVVNIIDEFREGGMIAPPDMAAYIDELRRVAVDLRKHATTVAEVRSLLKLHLKLKEMGIGSEQVDRWIDVCQDIASDTVSSRQFIKSALELAEATAERNLTYESSLRDCHDRLEELQALEAKIKRKREELDHLKTEYDEAKQRASDELNSITNAIATAQDAFAEQKRQLKTQLNEYLAQHKLSWKKVTTVIALASNRLSESSLTQGDIDDLGNDIVAAGSLALAIKQLQGEKERIQAEVDRLAKDKELYNNTINKLEQWNQESWATLLNKKQEEENYNGEIKGKKTELAELEEKVSQIELDIYITGLILNFLRAPDKLSDYDLDRFVNLMIAVRRVRLGMKPKCIQDVAGNTICECEIPRIYTYFSDNEVNTDFARELFAADLVPLVRDKFVYKLEQDVTQLEKSVAELEARRYKEQLQSLEQLSQRILPEYMRYLLLPRR